MLFTTEQVLTDIPGTKIITREHGNTWKNRIATNLTSKNAELFQ